METPRPQHCPIYIIKKLQIIVYRRNRIVSYKKPPMSCILSVNLNIPKPKLEFFSFFFAAKQKRIRERLQLCTYPEGGSPVLALYRRNLRNFVDPSGAGSPVATIRDVETEARKSRALTLPINFSPLMHTQRRG